MPKKGGLLDGKKMAHLCGNMQTAQIHQKKAWVSTYVNFEIHPRYDLTLLYFFNTEVDSAPESMESEHEAVEPTFQIVDSTQRGKELLVDSLGYRYGVQRRFKTTTHWQCTVRPKGNACRAKVIQSASGFSYSNADHNHQNTPGAALVATIKRKIKDASLKDVFKPASSIVEEVIR